MLDPLQNKKELSCHKLAGTYPDLLVPPAQWNLFSIFHSGEIASLYISLGSSEDWRGNKRKNRTLINTDEADLPIEILQSRNSKAVISQGDLENKKKKIKSLKPDYVIDLLYISFCSSFLISMSIVFTQTVGLCDQKERVISQKWPIYYYCSIGVLSNNPSHYWS